MNTAERERPRSVARERLRRRGGGAAMNTAERERPRSVAGERLRRRGGGAAMNSEPSGSLEREVVVGDRGRQLLRASSEQRAAQS